MSQGQDAAACGSGQASWATAPKTAAPAGQASARRHGGSEARALPLQGIRLAPQRPSQDQGRGAASVVWAGGISVSPLQEAGVQGGSPGQGAGPRTRRTHAAHPVSTHVVSGSQMFPQAGSEHPQSTGPALGTCFPSMLLLKALCDLLQMP